MKFFLHVPAWLSAAQLPLQVVVLAYVGAGGLVGAAVVGGVMLTPVGEVVQEAVAPARQFVESVVPMSVPMLFPSDPRQAVASLPIGKPLAPSVATPTTLSAPVSIEDSTPEDVVAEATPTAVLELSAPPRSAPGAPNVAQPALAPDNLAPSEIGLPDQSGPSAIGAVVVPPIAVIEPAAPALFVRPAVAEPALGGSRAELAAETRARTADAPAPSRIATGNAANDSLRAATVASPGTIIVHAASSRASEPAPTSTAVPTPRPTTAPAVSAPTPVPTVVERDEQPTRVPTAVPPTSAPTQEPKKTAVPTQEPKKTAVPAQVPTRVPPRTVKATPEPSRAAPPATAVKEKEKDKEKEKEKERRPTPVPTAPRRDSNDHGGQSGDNHNQSSKGHEGG